MGRTVLVSLMIPFLCACVGIVPAATTGAPAAPATPASAVTPAPESRETATDVASPSPGTAHDEQAVYAVFLAQNPGITLIRQDTATDTAPQSAQETAELIKAGLPGISDETIADYAKQNEQASQQLPADMELGVAYQLLSAADLAEISSQPNWGEVLQERYPDTEGYLFFSRVGFDAAHQQALVYVGRVYGPLGGEASYYLLKKVDGRWRIAGQINRVML
jgi:hypothetical protein